MVARTGRPGALSWRSPWSRQWAFTWAHRLAEIADAPTARLPDVVYYQRQSADHRQPAAAGQKSPLWPALHAAGPDDGRPRPGHAASELTSAF